MAEIYPLPPDVAAQIESSTAITSLSDVIFGLLQNAFDAQATRINVDVDFVRASCSVEDDGCGISPADFSEDGGLGKPHHTSKQSDVSSYSSHGTFLASVAALSILSITSCHHAFNTTNALTLHHSRPIVRLIPAPAHLQLTHRHHGTRVAVHDLFGNMPVRVKQRPVDEAASKFRDTSWSCACQVVTGMVLAIGRPINVIMRASDEAHVYRIKTLDKAHLALSRATKKLGSPSSFEPALVRSILEQGTSLNAASCDGWIKTSAKTASLTIRALISPEPAPSKQLQFISLADRFMPPQNGCWMLYDTINDLFMDSSFAVREETQGVRAKDLWMTNKQLRGGGKGIDRWPMFFIRIDTSTQQSRQESKPKSNPSGRLSEIADVLTTMILSFLEAHKLRPRNRRAANGRDALHLVVSPSRQPTSLADLEQRNARDIGPTLGLRTKVLATHLKQRKTLGDLEQTINLPRTKEKSFPKPISDNAITSRIKTSSSHDKETVRDRSDANCHRQNLEVIPTIRAQQQTYDHQASLGVIKAQSPSHVNSETKEDCTGAGRLGNGDAVIRWTHPITKQVHQLNARTGCEVNQILDSRPASTDDRMMQMTLSRHQGSLPQRIVRTSSGFACPAEGSWAGSFFDKWENPVFQRSEEKITQATNEALDDTHRALGGPSRFSYQQVGEGFVLPSHSRITKADLENAIFISQIDSKYILIRTQGSSRLHTESVNDIECSKLVLVDQHAADERIRVESLLEGLCRPVGDKEKAIQSPLGYRSQIETTPLQRPVFFDLQTREHAVLKRHAAHFARWGILYDLISNRAGPSIVESQDACRLVVLALPPSIAERCRIEPKVLIEMIRGEAWRVEESCRPLTDSSLKPCIPQQGNSDGSDLWLQRVANCPKEILEMLNSRSCRSAIMFNDNLSQQQCKDLVRDLSRCHFPFQCAHGRPSMVPLVNLTGPNTSSSANGGLDEQPIRETNFLEAWREWSS